MQRQVSLRLSSPAFIRFVFQHPSCNLDTAYLPCYNRRRNDTPIALQ